MGKKKKIKKKKKPARKKNPPKKSGSRGPGQQPAQPRGRGRAIIITLIIIIAAVIAAVIVSAIRHKSLSKKEITSAVTTESITIKDKKSGKTYKLPVKPASANIISRPTETTGSAKQKKAKQ